MTNDPLDSFLKKARSVMSLVEQGAYPGEQKAAAGRLEALAKTAKTLAEQASEPKRSIFVRDLRQISPVLVGEMGDILIAEAPKTAPKMGPSFRRSNPSDSRRTGATATARSSPQFRVGSWVCRISTGRVAIIEARTRPVATPNGPELVFQVDGESPPLERAWREFDLRLATEKEIASEQASRAAVKAEQERWHSELRRDIDAELQRFRNMGKLRLGAELYAVAKKSKRKTEMLCGTAWDGRHFVLFESEGGLVKTRKIVGSKGAATRAYNTKTQTGYETQDAVHPRFDRLCQQLVAFVRAQRSEILADFKARSRS